MIIRAQKPNPRSVANGRAWYLVAMSLYLLFVPVIPVQAQAEDPRLAEQTTIESDAGMSGRARKALFRARGHQDKGDHAKAVEVISQWMDGNPDRNHHLLFFTRATSYGQLEQNGRALQDLESAVTLEPRFGRAWLNLGETAYGLEEFSTAAGAFTQAYALTPDAPPEILLYAGVTRLMSGEPVKARSDLEKLLTEAERVPPLDWYRAYLAAVQGAGPTEATPDLVRRLIEDHQDDGAAWQLAAQDVLGREDYEQAAIYLTVADYLGQLTYSELIQLADLYAAISVPLQAAHYVEQAIALGEREPVTGDFERLASAYLAAHKESEARGSIARGLAVGETLQLWSLLGDLDYMDKNYAAALLDFQKCHTLADDFGRGWLMMGYCALELGNKDQARQYLEKAQTYPNQASSAGTLLNSLR